MATAVKLMAQANITAAARTIAAMFKPSAHLPDSLACSHFPLLDSCLLYNKTVMTKTSYNHNYLQPVTKVVLVWSEAIEASNMELLQLLQNLLKRV